MRECLPPLNPALLHEQILNSESIEPTKTLTLQEEKEIIHWVISHQSFGEVIVSLNKQQQREFLKQDRVGAIALPNYYRE